MSFAGDEKLTDAHKTQLKLPIHRGLVALNRTGPPLAELCKTSQTDLSSIVSVDPNMIVLELELVEEAIQLHDVNVHWLELEMVTGEYMRKARLVELAEELDADQLHDVNVHWLELEMVAAEESMRRA